jgi:oxygen-dependent protoporphyrinogen oxidase
MKVAVVGGGVAGLLCALRLRQRGHDPIVFEREAIAGGKVRTERVGEWQLELGPAALTDNAPPTQGLFRELDLAPAIITSSEAARRRYLLREGRLRELPDSPPKLLFSRALSLGDRWRLLREPAAPSAPPGVDESVGELARRRLGPELASRVVEPMVSGVFAGDYDRLSAASAFPRLVALEREHGSLLKALVALERARRANSETAVTRLQSLRGGMGALSEALALRLGDSLHVRAEVIAVERDSDGLMVRTASGPVRVDRVILALPPEEAAGVCRPLDPGLADAYGAIPTCGIASVSLGYARPEVAHPLDGFGFLVPRVEGVRLLGALFVTSTFPSLPQAPAGQVLIRCMIGGAHDPQAADLDDQALVEVAREGLSHALGLGATPRFTHVVRWRRGIAQYLIGHRQRVATIEQRGAQLGLYATGAALRGVGVHDVVRDANAVVERLA